MEQPDCIPSEYCPQKRNTVFSQEKYRIYLIEAQFSAARLWIEEEPDASFRAYPKNRSRSHP
jgi:hypothetical protein